MMTLGGVLVRSAYSACLVLFQHEHVFPWLIVAVLLPAPFFHVPGAHHVSVISFTAPSFGLLQRAMRAQARQVLTGVLGFMMYKLALVSITVLPPMSHSSVAEVQRRA